MAPSARSCATSARATASSSPTASSPSPSSPPAWRCSCSARSAPSISVYIRDKLHAGPLLYGGISAMVGVGLIAGTPLVRAARARRPLAELVLAPLVGLGFGAGLLGAFHFPAHAPVSTVRLSF